jgi:hypothetical protein
MLSVFFRKKISIFGPPEGGPKTPHRENVPFSLCAISCGAPSRRDGWLHNKPHIQFALQSYRLNLQLNAQFLDPPPSGGIRGLNKQHPPCGRGHAQKIARRENGTFSRCGVFRVPPEGAPKKLLDSKTVRFCGKVFIV